MEHKGTVTLDAEKITLRRFEKSDSIAIYNNLYSDSEAMRFLPWDTHTDVSETMKHITNHLENYSNPAFYAWVIVRKEEDEPIGFIDTVIDVTINAAKVDYGIGEKWWRKGYASDALSSVMRYLFEDVGVNRVFATHDPRNPNSGKVMEKCGMKYEGTLRQARYRKGEFSDRKMYSMLAEDFAKYGRLVETGASYVHAPFEPDIAGKPCSNDNGATLSIDDVRTLTEQGNPNALNDLGIAYMTGQGVERDAIKAVGYFTKAIEQQHTAACANLAICYADGIGADKDMQIAVRLFAIAFRQARPGEINIESYFG